MANDRLSNDSAIAFALYRKEGYHGSDEPSVRRAEIRSDGR